MSFYHGTSCKNIKSIQREGLKAGLTPNWDISDCEGVYVTEDLETATGYALTAIAKLNKHNIKEPIPEYFFDDVCIVEVQLDIFDDVEPDTEGDLCIMGGLDSSRIKNVIHPEDNVFIDALKLTVLAYGDEV